MLAHPLLRRLLSPAGLVLVAICFALPFVAVSCDQPGVSVSATYTGTDLLAGGAPSVSVTGTGVSKEDAEEESDAPIDVQPTAVLALVAIIAGILVPFLPARRMRLILGTAAAAAALLLLVVNQILVKGYLTRELERELGSELPAGNSAGDFVGTRYGFWVAASLAAAVTIYQCVELYFEVRPRTASPVMAEPPPAVPEPPPS